MANSIKLPITVAAFEHTRSAALEQRSIHGDPSKDFWIRDTFAESRRSKHIPILGFSIKVTAADNISYTLDWTNKIINKPKRTKIGDAHDMPIEVARKKANKLKQECLDGNYPSAHQRMPEIQTVREVLNFYLKHRFKDGGGKMARYTVKRILPILGDANVHDLTRKDITDMLDTIESEYTLHGRMAALSYFKSGWDYCQQYNNLEVDNPAKNFKNPKYDKKAARKRTEAMLITGEHYPLINKALDEIDTDANRNPFISLAIRMMLYTGNRKREITDIKLSDIDMNTGVIAVPENKTNDTTKEIQITEQLKRIITLARRERMRLDISEVKNPYLFVAMSSGKNKTIRPHTVYDAIGHTWKVVRKSHPSLASTTPGKSRHGQISLMRAKGYTNEQIAMVTGHEDTSMIDKHYAFNNKSEVVSRTQEIADTIEQLGKY